MPLFHFQCEDKHSKSKLFRRVQEVPASFPCEICGKDMKRQLSAPASTSKISVDNGFQARAVEIHPDIVEINEARSNKNYREN